MILVYIFTIYWIGGGEDILATTSKAQRRIIKRLIEKSSSVKDYKLYTNKLIEEYDIKRR